MTFDQLPAVPNLNVSFRGYYGIVKCPYSRANVGKLLVCLDCSAIVSDFQLSCFHEINFENLVEERE